MHTNTAYINKETIARIYIINYELLGNYEY